MIEAWGIIKTPMFIVWTLRALITGEMLELVGATMVGATLGKGIV